MAAGPLSELKILDLTTGPVGGIATMVLADFGADVLKVERPEGDPYRALPNSPMWLRGKRSAALDLGEEQGRAELQRLVESTDAVISTFSPSTALRLAADFETLQAIKADLVYCRISSFGSTGPYANYPGYEGVVAAKSGRMMNFAGLPQREGPVYSAVQVASHACAMSTVAGTLAAIFDRDRTGSGRLIETSMLQGMIPYELGGLVTLQLRERRPDLFPDVSGAYRMPTLNYHPLPTKDGTWLQAGNLLQHLFDNYLAATGLADIYSDPRYQHGPTTWTAEDREALRDRMLLRMMEKTSDEWMDIFVENGGVAMTRFRSTQDSMIDQDLILNGHLVERAHPNLGAVRQLGLLGRLTETAGTVGPVGPAVGEGSNSEWAAPETRPHTNGSHAAVGVGPLSGVTVLELSTVIASPLGAAMLADLGARVIKVETIGGDPYRWMGAAGVGASKTNAGKESISIDLKSAAGQTIVHQLAAKSDILIHNFRPGVPERLGIAYEALKEINPQLVYLSVNGYGPEGPGAHRPSTHPIPGAAVGGALMQAGPDTPPKRNDTVEQLRETARKLFRANESNPDPNTSMVVLSTSVLGLLAREKTGKGQKIYIDMLGANAYANADDFIAYEGKAARPEPDAELMGLSATYRLYEAAGGWVFLALITGSEWATFCEITGASALGNDPRFATRDGRIANDPELVDALSELLGTKDADTWEAMLAPNGIGCVRADAAPAGLFFLEDEHVRANGFVLEADHANYGRYLRHGPVVGFEGVADVCGPGVLSGENTDAILSELGYDEEQIARLRTDGVAWSEEPNPLAAAPASETRTGTAT